MHPLTPYCLLQQVAKLKPNIFARYQLSLLAEKCKALKGSVEGGMDLQSYVEFKRNYRALVRVHKAALQRCVCACVHVHACVVCVHVCINVCVWG